MTGGADTHAYYFRDLRPLALRVTGPAPENALIWVDIGAPVEPAELWGSLRALELAGLDEQHVRRLVRGQAGPRTPSALLMLEPQSLGGLDLLVLSSISLIQIGDAASRSWSVLGYRVACLAGPGWLLTARLAPIDLHSGSSWGQPALAHALLLQATARLRRAAPADLAAQLLITLGERTLSEAFDISDQIDNRATDFHRKQIEGDGRPVSALQHELFALRWATDSAERTLRRLAAPADPALRAWLAFAGDRDAASDSLALHSRALDVLQAARRALGDALSWVAQQEAASVLSRQEQAELSDATLRKAINLVATLLLGPGLVAAVFGAMPGWFDSRPSTRFAIMGAAMIASALGLSLLFRERKEK